MLLLTAAAVSSSYADNIDNAQMQSMLNAMELRLEASEIRQEALVRRMEEQEDLVAAQNEEIHYFKAEEVRIVHSSHVNATFICVMFANCKLCFQEEVVHGYRCVLLSLASSHLLDLICIFMFSIMNVRVPY